MVRIGMSLNWAEQYGQASHICIFSNFIGRWLHRNTTSTLFENVLNIPEHLVESTASIEQLDTHAVHVSKEAGKKVCTEAGSWNDVDTQPVSPMSRICGLQKDGGALHRSILINQATCLSKQVIQTNINDSAGKLKGMLHKHGEQVKLTEVPADSTNFDHANRCEEQDIDCGKKNANCVPLENGMHVDDGVLQSVCANNANCPKPKPESVSIDEDEDLHASMLALATYLYRSKNMSLQDASAIAENAPNYVANLKVRSGNWGNISLSFRCDCSIKSTVESFLENNGLNEFEPFFESIGMNPSFVSATSLSLHIELTGEHGVLPAITLLEGIGVKRRDLGKLIERNMSILSYSASDIRLELDFLMHLGLQKADLASVIYRCPEILKLNLKEGWAPLLETFKKYFVGEHAIARLLKHHPKQLAELPNVQTNLDYLYSLGLKNVNVAKILKRTPSVLFMDVEKSLKVKIQFLKDQGLSDGEISRAVSLFPGIFSRSIKNTLHPKVKFLQSLGLEKEQIAKAICSFPALLGHSIEDKMKPVVALLHAVGLEDELVARFIAVRPSIFAVDVKNALPDFLEMLVKLGDSRTTYLVLSWGLCEGLSALKERLEYLSSLGFNREQLRKMIHEDPRILQISKLRLEKKVAFLTKTMGYSVKDLINNPTFLYSHFERRIQFRHAVLNILQSVGILGKKPSLSQITRRSDKKFRKKYVDPYPQYMAILKRTMKLRDFTASISESKSVH